eukprot:3260922-Pyramimonas_sp.AAC.1
MLWRVVVSTSAQTLTRPRPRRVSATESWLRTGSTAGWPLSGAAVAWGCCCLRPRLALSARTYSGEYSTSSAHADPVPRG